MKTILNSLVDVKECVLVLIDIQDSFLHKLPQEESELLLERAGWLVEVAKILQVPLVVTVEEIECMGPVSPSLAAKLLPPTPVFNKMIFNLADNPEILQAVRATGRKTAVLAGLETDVCIAQSALGLMECGFQVAVLADVTASPGGAHAAGLERMKNAGALVTGLKSLYYEWVRSVDRSNRIRLEHFDRIGRPGGIVL